MDEGTITALVGSVCAMVTALFVYLRGRKADGRVDDVSLQLTSQGVQIQAQQVRIANLDKEVKDCEEDRAAKFRVIEELERKNHMQLMELLNVYRVNTDPEIARRLERLEGIISKESKNE